MNQSNSISDQEFYGEPGLERFIDRLSPGMQVEGRVVDMFENNIIILRVWGYNILAESRHKFAKHDEVILHVQAIQPKLIFQIRPIDQPKTGALYA